MSKTKKKPTLVELLEEALVPEEEQPYKVPENWVWVKTGFVADWGSGGTPSRKRPDFYNGNIPWIKTGNLRDSFVENVDEYITEKGLQHSSAKLFPKGSLAIAMYGATIGRLGILDFDAATNQACAVGVPNKSINNIKYLFYYFMVKRSDLVSLGKGGAQPNISQTIIKSFPIPLPPINEQKRIATKVERLLDKVDRATQLIEEAKETFELRRAAILQKAFRGELTEQWRNENLDVESADVLLEKIREEREASQVGKRGKKLDSYEPIEEPYPLPKGWKWVRLGEIVDINPKKDKLENIDDEELCSFIPMPLVDEYYGKINEPELKPYLKVKKGYTYFREGDIIFAKITPCMENGKSAIIKGVKKGFGFGSTEFHVLRPFQGIQTEFIHSLVLSKIFRLHAKKAMTGAVGQQRVPKEFLNNFSVPLPPTKEQKEIIKIINKSMNKIISSDKLIELEHDLNSLKQSILSKAFKGELSNNNPEDGHALDLLKDVLQAKINTN